MTQDSQNTPWPLPKFYFIVNWGTASTILFQEVSGLGMEPDSLMSQQSKIPTFSAKAGKIPPISLKKGRLTRAQLEWFSQLINHPMAPQPVVIKLMDETGTAIMGWSLHNARPTQIIATELEPNINEIAIECLVLEYEGFSLETG